MAKIYRNQIEDINYFIDRKVDLLIVAPKNTAAAYESQGEACRQSGDLWGAKSQYLSAKSVYQELGSDEDVQRIEGILSDIDMQITEG